LIPAISKLGEIQEDRHRQISGGAVMRTLIIVVLAVLAIIFVAGTLNIGGAPIFYHLDSMLDTDLFMDLHDSIFFFVYRWKDRADSGISRTKSDLRKFEEKPAGIDNKGYQRKIDNVSK
jgi:hypothetical protein